MTASRGSARWQRGPRSLGRLAWLVYVVAEGMAAACVVLLLAGQVSFSDAVNAYLVTNLSMVVTFAAIGGLVAGNRPRNSIGWLFLGYSACFAVATLAGTIAVSQQANLPDGSLRALLIVFIGLWPLGIGIALPLAVQLFPTGRPLSPRWRWLIGLTVVSGLAFAAQTVLDPAEWTVTDHPVAPLIRPAVFHAADPLWAVATLLLVVVLAASVAELVVRFRRARGVERLQLTWLMWAVTLFAVFNSQRFITGNGPILLLLTLPLVPAAAAVAILRYDLYDIRAIVNRTLVYGLLTALLGLGYAGAVLALGQLAGQDHNSLVVAGATLAVAGLFQPARRRVQAAVDRRFNRRRYDAARTVAAFAARLREQVDLDALSTELLAVVDQTVQPSRTSLWLRPPATPRPQPRPLAGVDAAMAQPGARR
jgi:two-component system, NarL family, sensor kinase